MDSSRRAVERHESRPQPAERRGVRECVSPPPATGGLAKRAVRHGRSAANAALALKRRGRPRRPQPGSGSPRAPWIGTRTRRRRRRPAPVRQAVRLGAEQPGGGPGAAAGVGEVVQVGRRRSRSAASTVQPGRPQRVDDRDRRRGPRTTSRWNRLPALARTHLPLYGSTASPAKTTAPAPAASAVRSTCRRCPGRGSRRAPRPAAAAGRGPRPARRRAAGRPRPGPAA